MLLKMMAFFFCWQSKLVFNSNGISFKLNAVIGHYWLESPNVMCCSVMLCTTAQVVYCTVGVVEQRGRVPIPACG